MELNQTGNNKIVFDCTKGCSFSKLVELAEKEEVVYNWLHYFLSENISYGGCLVGIIMHLADHKKKLVNHPHSHHDRFWYPTLGDCQDRVREDSMEVIKRPF